ncbi:single stranded DNA-binding domain-containing protein [Nigerium massiliense]|uniref:OB-fold nucleic acid binding domain-containing protein n=1 Tax=Nigerium massiliense TaxID=1522317 RepID=UPI00058CB3EA|nr:OB-fold nucleic acid binding domain-containing protein [Nigerium massiliense]
MATIKDWFSRLGRSTDELASDERRREAEFVGANTVAQCSDREKVRLRGTIQVLTVHPIHATPWLEAEMSDGTGTVSLIFMGRREIPGIDAGRDLVVEGRISDDEGQRRIYNPWYQLL